MQYRKVSKYKSFKIFYRASRWLQRGCVYSLEKKIECSLLQNQFSSFRLILQRRINFALGIGANIRISYRLNQYILGRLMGFSISFLAECVPYGGAYRQLLRDFYVYGIVEIFRDGVSGKGKAGTIMAFTSRFLNVRYPGRRRKRMANVARDGNGKIIGPNAMRQSQRILGIYHGDVKLYYIQTFVA